MHPVGNDPNNSGGNPGTQGSSQPAGTFHVDGQGTRLPCQTLFFHGCSDQSGRREKTSRAEASLSPIAKNRKEREVQGKRTVRDKAGSGSRDHLVGHKDRTGREAGGEGSRKPRKENAGISSRGQQGVEETFARRSGADPDDLSSSIGPLRESRSGTWQRGSGDPCRREIAPGRSPTMKGQGSLCPPKEGPGFVGQGRHHQKRAEALPAIRHFGRSARREPSSRSPPARAPGRVRVPSCSDRVPAPRGENSGDTCGSGDKTPEGIPFP